jgi:hypothetical protein
MSKNIMIYKATDLLDKLTYEELKGIINGELIFEDWPEKYWPFQQDM